MASNIQFKRGTAAALYAANPVLLRGEPGLEIDTNKIKYGNGVTPWRDLPYANPALEVVDGGTIVAPAVPAVPGIFTPPTLDGLVLWLDADDADYTHKVNNRVSLWEDLSDTRAQFFQSNKANRPSATNQIAEQDVVTFDGTNDAMLGNFELPAEFTLLVALRRRGSSTNGKLLTAYSANSATELVLCGTETGNSIGVSDGEDFYATQPVDDLVPVVYTLQFTAEGFSTRLNGLNTQADTLASAAAKTVMAIGGDRVDFSADNFGGDVAEIVMYDRVLTAADLLDAENYMMERWGIVQVSHPLLEGMKAFWPLNEESGNRIDITDAEIPLTPTGTVGFEAGVIGNAANFTGGANYLAAPADFTLSGAFSVSVWFKPAAVTGSAPQIIQNWAGGMQGQMVLGFGDEGNETGVVWAYVRTADDNYRVSAPDLEANRWYHVVLVFNQTGNRLLLYVDGVLADQAVTAGNLMSTSIPLRVGVGEQTTAPNTVAFLVDQLGIWDRVLSAADVEMLYNDELGKEDFTADLYGDNVSLLLHMDKPANAVGGPGGGAGGSSLNNGLTAFWKLDDLTDSSGNNHTLVNYGATFTPGKIGNAATLNGYSHLRAPAVTQPTTAFTLSAWVYLNSINGGQGAMIVDSITGNNWAGGGCSLDLIPSGQVRVGAFWGNIVAAGNSPELASFYTDSNATISLNQWYHVAGTFDTANATFKIYIDGVLDKEIMLSVPPGPFGGDLTNTFGIGSNADGTWGFVDGQIDAVGIWDRVLTAAEISQLYNNGAGTETFEPTDPNFNDVTLLLNLNGPTITDSSPKAHQITNNGATISTDQSKFGGSSAYFDGASSFTTPDPELGTGNFTLELWFKADAGGGPQYATLFANYPQDATSGFGLYFNDNGAGAGGIGLYSAYIICNSTNAFNDTSWHHVAVTRNGNNFSLYVDGVLEGTGTNTRNLSSPSAMFGNSPEIAGRNFTGWIDDIRITKNVVRYTANFDPPTAEFPLGPIKTVTMPTVETALLLHMDDADFVDSGENGLTFTANNTAAISTLQSKFGGSSLILDGNDGFLSAPHNNTLVFDGDFTVELFAYFDATPTGIFSFCGVWDQNPNYSWLFACVPEGLRLYWSSDGVNGGDETVSWTPTTGQWYHIALCRAGNIVRFFVNGAQIGPAITTTAAYNQSSAPITIGAAGFDGHYFSGYIDEVRITKGAALYATNFTPPTAPFADPQPTPDLLITFDDGIEDLSANAHTITNNNNVTAELPVPPAAGFGNAGGFNGTNSYLVIPDAPEFDLSSGPFCIELRFYAADLGADLETGSQALIAKDQNGVSFSWAIIVSQTQIRAATANIAGDWDFLVTQAVSENTWHHIALTGDGSTMKMFFNGVLVGTKNRTLTNASADVTIGCFSYNNPNGFFGGYIDDVRIVKGAQVYTANFTPPTASLLPPAVTPAPDLLLHFDGTSGSTTFTDSGKNQLTPVVNGDASISTTQSKFGGSSGYFDGATDHLKFESGPWGGWNDSDWTIEFWIWPVSVTGYAPLFLADSSLNLHLYNTGDLYLNNATTGAGGLVMVGALLDSQWQHVAVVRRDGISYLYINGILQGSAAVPYSNGPGTTLEIGGAYSQSAYFNGYIDELRVVKGHALYTGAFTPPTAPFQNPIITITQPAAGLANGLEAFWKFDDLTDSSGNNHTLTDIGYVTFVPGKLGQAAYFDGSSQSLKLSGLRFATSAGYTINCWAKHAVNSPTLPLFFQAEPFTWGWTPLVAMGFYYAVVGSNDGAGPKANTYDIAPITSIDGEWHMYTAVYDGLTLKFYIDGQLHAEAQFDGAANGIDSWPLQDIYIGSGVQEYYCEKWLDALGIWSRPLSVSDVSALYNNGNGTETLTGGGGGGSAGPITTFIDSSKHNHELTAVGNAYLNLTDIKYGNSSGEFAGGHCTVTMSPEFAFGTGDFTVEFWGNLTYAANSAVFSIAPESEEAGTYLIGFRNDPNMFGFCYDMPNFTFVSADISAYYGEWAHYAFVRLDGVLKMYVNGTQVGTANTTIDLDGGTQTTAVIGRRWVDVDDHYLAGLIDDLRITKGVARYIANFNPPTKAFPDPVLVAPPAPTGDIYAENVTLLLHMDGANGSTTFTDNSYLQNTVTVDGNVVISTAQSKWGGASAYFDGSSYVSVTQTQQEFTFGANDFTIEFWIRDNNSPTGVFNAVISNAQTTDNGIWFGRFDDSTVRLLIGADNVWDVTDSITGNVFDGEWHHVAIARAGNNVRVFVDGTAALETTTTVSIPNPENLFVIGSSPNYSQYFTGYIDDFRITKGVARYTADFTPPTEAFPNPFVPGVDATLLMHFDGAFDDVGKNGLTFTATGGAALSTAQSKFGGSSAYFDGQAGTSLSAPSSADFAFDGDFTVEAWIYRTGNGTVAGGTAFAQIATALGADDATGWTLFISGGTNLNFLGSTGNGWQVVVAGPATVPLNQWCHIAVTRSGSAIKIFVDGVEAVSGSSSDSIVSGTNLYIGSYPLINGYAQTSFAGHIDELRIIKGTAVYTANFTPPTAPFTPTAAVTPADITGCDLWLDSTGDIAESNGAILTWADKSGNGRTATPADYAPAPVVAAGDGPNGQDVVRFSGDPNVLDVSYQFNLKNSSGFVLFKHAEDITNSPYARFLSFQPTTGFDYDQADGLSLSTNTNNPTGLGIYNNSLSATYATPLPLGWTLLAYTIDENGAVKLRVDGEEVVSAMFTGIAAKAGGNLYIGHGGALMLMEALQGDIAEIALFDHALGEAALIGLERGIMQRWFPAPTPPGNGETILLLHFDGAVNTPTFVDASPLAQPISAEMGTVITDTQAKFNQSVYFNGSPHRVYTNSSPIFDLSSGSYTIEFWLYLNAVLPGDAARLFTFESDSGARIGMLLYQDPGDTLYRLAMNQYGIPVGFNTPDVVPPGQWTHIALVRDGANTALYVNGVSAPQTLFGGANWHEQVFVPDSYSVSIGANTGAFSFYGLDGYIDEFRIVKGAAVYTGNFTPPTKPFDAPSLLLHFDNDFSDSSGSNVSVTNNGVTFDTTNKQFGAASAVFVANNGTTLTTPSSPDFGFGTGDFTIEMFVYMTQGGGGRYSVITVGSYTDGILWRLSPVFFETCLFLNTNVTQTAWNWRDGGTGGTGGTVPYDQWTHIALTRQNNVVRVFVAGAKIYEQDLGVIDLGSSHALTIGCSSHEFTELDAFDGLIDELRIIKGKAMYTNTFTPPAAPFN